MDDDEIDTKGISELLKLKREYVTDVLVKRADFPRPVTNITRRIRRWSRSDVERFKAGKAR